MKKSYNVKVIHFGHFRKLGVLPNTCTISAIMHQFFMVHWAWNNNVLGVASNFHKFSKPIRAKGTIGHSNLTTTDANM